MDFFFFRNNSTHFVSLSLKLFVVVMITSSWHCLMYLKKILDRVSYINFKNYDLYELHLNIILLFLKNLEE